MKIGRQDQRSSAISTSNQDTILIRGHDLSGELIGSIGFTEHFWLLLTGVMPSPAQRHVLDATLVAIAEHGLVPSVQANRITFTAAPEALQGAVAAAAGIVREYRAASRAIPGYGQPLHKQSDPCALRLFQVTGEGRVIRQADRLRAVARRGPSDRLRRCSARRLQGQQR